MSTNKRNDKATLTTEMRLLKEHILQVAKLAYEYDKQHTNDDTPKKQTGMGALELMLSDMTEEIYPHVGYYDDDNGDDFNI